MDSMDDNQSQYRRSGGIRPGSIAATIAQIIWVCIVFIVIVLILRVILSLIGAVQENDFASFIYSVTGPFIEPFRGLLQVSEYQVGVSRLEFETIVAIVVYLLAGWGVTAVVQALRR